MSSPPILRSPPEYAADAPAAAQHPATGPYNPRTHDPAVRTDRAMRVAQRMNGRELAGRAALVTGVTRRAGIGAAIARELGAAGAKLFVTFFRHYDEQQAWGVGPTEPEALL